MNVRPIGAGFSVCAVNSRSTDPRSGLGERRGESAGVSLAAKAHRHHLRLGSVGNTARSRLPDALHAVHVAHTGGVPLLGQLREEPLKLWRRSGRDRERDDPHRTPVGGLRASSHSGSRAQREGPCAGPRNRGGRVCSVRGDRGVLAGSHGRTGVLRGRRRGFWLRAHLRVDVRRRARRAVVGRRSTRGGTASERQRQGERANDGAVLSGHGLGSVLRVGRGLQAPSRRMPDPGRSWSENCRSRPLSASWSNARTTLSHSRRARPPSPRWRPPTAAPKHTLPWKIEVSHALEPSRTGPTPGHRDLVRRAEAAEERPLELQQQFDVTCLEHDRGPFAGDANPARTSARRPVAREATPRQPGSLGVCSRFAETSVVARKALRLHESRWQPLGPFDREGTPGWVELLPDSLPDE
jgi:hypothetical protein